MCAQLFDAFGRPARYAPRLSTGGASFIPDVAAEGTRLPTPALDYDIATLLTRQRHRMLLSDARLIASKMPLVAGALEQKAQYVTQAGFDPVFQGADEAWGELARAALIEAHKRFDVRGSLWTWERDWEIACRTLDIDGDFFILHGPDTPDGYPTGQFIEAHRIGSAWGDTLVIDGEFTGRRILNGIIYDEYGREIGYRILNDAPYSDQPHRDVSARDMTHCATPRWFSDGRPFPTVAYAILDWYDVLEARGYQRTKNKINSMLTLIESTPEGKAPNDVLLDALRETRNTPPPADSAGNARLITHLDGGLIRYVKAGAGDIKAHGDPTPGDGWLKFDERVVQGAFYGMGWRVEMLDLSKLSGAPTRGFQDQINTVIQHRWRDLISFVRRTDLTILAKLITNGKVPPHPEWTNWTYVPPADFTVDLGRSNKADLDNVRAGVDTLTSIIGRFGRRTRDVYTERAKELQLQARLEKEYGLAPGTLGTLAQPGQPAPGDQPAPAAPAPTSRP